MEDAKTNVIDKVIPLLDDMTKILDDADNDELLSLTVNRNGYAYIMLRVGSRVATVSRCTSSDEWKMDDFYSDR